MNLNVWLRTMTSPSITAIFGMWQLTHSLPAEPGAWCVCCSIVAVCGPFGEMQGVLCTRRVLVELPEVCEAKADAEADRPMELAAADRRVRMALRVTLNADVDGGHGREP